ncbi:MAG: hypothetical protein E7329_11340 [Clostridiales bacterium]|nr:hypothetical protein [Clostridiales bacterium]
MIIHNKMPGGNIFVDKQEGSHVYLKNELRDTTEDWFYWAFCAEGAQGQEITFHFQPERLGYWGPAVSHDLVDWHWYDQLERDSFTYRFGDDEEKVYFAHSMLYLPHQFEAFTLECTYAGAANNKVSQQRLRETGRCFGRALRKMVGENQELRKYRKD